MVSLERRIFVRFPKSVLLCVVLFTCLGSCWKTTYKPGVPRPRGVSLSQKVFYEFPDATFNCLDGSGRYPYLFVNDDYCDCLDGTDEPGTSACPNGYFHCINSGYISRNIPSSRVNDNICDCCDGSDEYNSSAECPNSCLALGNQAREEARKQEELYRKGHQMFQEYSSQGKQLKENNKVKLISLKQSETAAETVRVEKEAIKNEAESKEKAALSKYEAAKEELKQEAEELEMQKHEAEENLRAGEAFKELDLNNDGMLSFEELQKFLMFDSNRDGTVSEEEAKFYLHMKESMDLEEFVTTGWMIMKPIYLADKLPQSTPSPSDISSEPSEPQYESESTDDASYDHEEELLDDEYDEPFDDQPDFPPKEIIEPEVDKTEEQEYDEETHRLINEANESRNIYKEASDKLQAIRNDIKQIEDDIATDFGTEEEFAALKGQCFQFDDREYIYKLCPFDKASQEPKSGGSDVSLGKWGHWVGSEENIHSKMKFENGQGCWNGPSRSTTVMLYCGLENKVLSASEPNRCEYLFEFSTPAVCYAPQEVPKIHEHTEL